MSGYGLTPGPLTSSHFQLADIYIGDWDGRKIAFDVSVTSPTQENLIFQAADRPAAAIEARKRQKIRVHAQNCRDQGVDFQPLVVETFGGWDSDALKFLKEIARIDARHWGKD